MHESRFPDDVLILSGLCMYACVRAYASECDYVTMSTNVNKIMYVSAGAYVGMVDN